MKNILSRPSSPEFRRLKLSLYDDPWNLKTRSTMHLMHVGNLGIPRILIFNVQWKIARVLNFKRFSRRRCRISFLGSSDEKVRIFTTFSGKESSCATRGHLWERKEEKKNIYSRLSNENSNFPPSKFLNYRQFFIVDNSPAASSPCISLLTKWFRVYQFPSWKLSSWN